jgi:quinol monooxygenase YgiN
VSEEAVLLVAELHGRTGLESQLRELLDELAAGCQAEPQCTGYRVLLAQEPGEFVMLGAWSSEAALREHYDTVHYRYYRDQVGPLLARPSDVVVHHISTTVHALDPSPPDPGLFG